MAMELRKRAAGMGVDGGTAPHPANRRSPSPVLSRQPREGRSAATMPSPAQKRDAGLFVLAVPIPSTDSLSVRPCFTFTIEHPSNATPEVLTMSDLAELEPLGHQHRVVVGVREDAAQ